MKIYLCAIKKTLQKLDTRKTSVSFIIFNWSRKVPEKLNDRKKNLIDYLVSIVYLMHI